MVKNRNIAVCVILSIVTCGIYSLIWYVSMTDDVRFVSGDNRISGGKALLLTIITCGIYAIYWNYQMGKIVFQAQIKKNMPASDNSILYLILSIFGLSLVSWCLIQSELNKMSELQA